MKIHINPFRTERWFNDDPGSLLDLVSLADQKGIDGIDLTEHVVMAKEELANYPFTDPNMRIELFDERSPFFDTVVQITMFAAVTKRARLGPGVMLTPLRPPTLLAKQIATLDQFSGGRIDLGIGVGWQRFEYEAEGWSWETRFGRMFEIAKACKALWSQAPARFHGKYVNFENAYSMPFPKQEGGVPQWFGVAPTERNIERMAEIADGWGPLGVAPDVVAETVKKIKARMTELGRDPSNFQVRLFPTPVYTDKGPDLDASLDAIPDLLKAGATHICLLVLTYCSGPEDYEPFLDKLIAAKERYQN